MAPFTFEVRSLVNAALSMGTDVGTAALRELFGGREPYIGIGGSELESGEERQHDSPQRVVHFHRLRIDRSG